MLAVPRGTVESRLHRAREKLRKRFKGYCNTGILPVLLRNTGETPVLRNAMRTIHPRSSAITTANYPPVSVMHLWRI